MTDHDGHHGVGDIGEVGILAGMMGEPSASKYAPPDPTAPREPPPVPDQASPPPLILVVISIVGFAGLYFLAKALG